MSIFRRLARGLGVNLPPPKEKPGKPDATLDFQFMETHRVKRGGHQPPRAAGPPPTKPPPKPRGATYIPFDSLAPQGAFQWPPSPELPKKKPERHVPVLDDEYFEGKRERGRSYNMGFPSASYYRGATSGGGYGIPSYYGHGTGGIWMEQAALCIRNGGHSFSGGRCRYCGTSQ